MLFLDVKIIRRQDKFLRRFYQKTFFCSVYAHFDNFLPNTWKIGITDITKNLF